MQNAEHMDVPLEVLSIKGVSVVFGAGDRALVAVDDVSLSVREGEFLCLLGPSGCGKSTLLKVVAGLIEPREGEVRIARNGGGPTLDAVMVWQEHALIPWRTIRENAAFSLELRGVPAKERHAAADKALAALGIADFGDYYARQLSGGMRQRAGIARALVADPRILLMDEPFAAVDAQTRRILQEQVLTLSQDLRKTIVFVTHSIEEALLLGDRVVVMSARPGRIKTIIEVPFNRPRGTAVRRSAEFQELEEHIWSLLRDEAARAELTA
jgi:NitT/TauT family transport system ATP-binding protein